MTPPDGSDYGVVFPAEVEMLLQQRHMGSLQINSIKMWSIDDRGGDDRVRGSGPIRLSVPPESLPLTFTGILWQGHTCIPTHIHTQLVN